MPLGDGGRDTRGSAVCPVNNAGKSLAISTQGRLANAATGRRATLILAGHGIATKVRRNIP